MHFTISHLVPGMSRSEYEEFFFDEASNKVLCERLNLERTLLSRDHDGADFAREVEVTMRRQVPGWVSKIVGEDKFVYTESMTYRFGEPPTAAHWRITPKMFARQVECTGAVYFDAHPEGVMRRVEGTVTVRIPGVGKLLERFAAREIEKSFNEAAALTLAWLAENPPPETRGQRVPGV